MLHEFLGVCVRVCVCVQARTVFCALTLEAAIHFGFYFKEIQEFLSLGKCRTDV